MKNNNNLPEPEIFTDKIEETIDDLFKPVKQIEIDPLTQEVKEVAPKEEESQEPEISLELSLEPEAVPETTESADEPEPELELEVAEAVATEEEEVAEAQEPEPEIELELVEESEAPSLEIEVEEPKEDTSDGLTARLDKLREDIYTIEWEVSGNELTEALSELKNILELPEIKGLVGVHSLLSLCAEVLERSKNAPQKMKANAPGLIKRSIEAVISMHSGSPVEKAEIEKLQDELTAILGQHELELQPAPEEKVAQAPETTESAEVIQEQISSPAAPEAPPAEESSATKSTSLSKEAEELLISHIQTLQKDVNRILPLEKLLSNTPGMEKLYKFHKNIRISLEQEIERLTNYFFEPGAIQLPKPDTSPKRKEEYEAEITGQKGCPWRQLLTFSIDGMEIGIPAEEVAYISEPPWLAKSFIKKADSLPLSKLKPWPWSKLAGLFTNKLAELDDKELSALEFPVITNLGETELPVSSSFYVIVLYDGEKGAVLRSPEAPISINVPENAKCQTNSGGALAGEVEINGTKISVLTAKSVNR